MIIGKLTQSNCCVTESDNSLDVYHVWKIRHSFVAVSLATHTHTLTHTPMHTNMCTRTHTHMCTRAHTHTHTQTLLKNKIKKGPHTHSNTHTCTDTVKREEKKRKSHSDFCQIDALSGKGTKVNVFSCLQITDFPLLQHSMSKTQNRVHDAKHANTNKSMPTPKRKRHIIYWM